VLGAGGPGVNRLNLVKYAEALEEAPKLEALAALTFRRIFNRYPGRPLRKPTHRETTLAWRGNNVVRYREARRKYREDHKVTIPRTVTIPGGLTFDCRKMARAASSVEAENNRRVI